MRARLIGSRIGGSKCNVGVRQNRFAGLVSDSVGPGRGTKICIHGRLPSDPEGGGWREEEGKRNMQGKATPEPRKKWKDLISLSSLDSPSFFFFFFQF